MIQLSEVMLEEASTLFTGQLEDIIIDRLGTRTIIKTSRTTNRLAGQLAAG